MQNKFIKLTFCSKNFDYVYLNIKYIKLFGKSKDEEGSFIYGNEGDSPLIIEETPEEIINLINNAE